MYRVGFQSALGFTPMFLQVASQSSKTHFCMSVVLCPSYDPVLNQDNVQRPLDTPMDLISDCHPPKLPGVCHIPGKVLPESKGQ